MIPMAKTIDMTTLRARIWIAVLFALPVDTARAQQGAAEIYVRTEGQTTVNLLSGANGRERVLYSHTKTGTTDVRVSPDAGRVALIEWSEGPLPADPHSTRIAQPSLVVVDTSGTVLFRATDSIQRYDWCGSTCIAAIAGVYSETDVGFIPSGLQILDVSTGYARAIERMRPLAVRWVSAHNALYIQSGERSSPLKIYKYDLASGVLTPTAHRDLDFSPSGRFYLYRVLGEPPQLVDSNNDAAVRLSVAPNVDIEGWLGGANDVLVGVKRSALIDSLRKHRLVRTVSELPKEPKEYVLIDAATGATLRQVVGDETPWRGRGGRLLIKASGRLAALTTARE